MADVNVQKGDGCFTSAPAIESFGALHDPEERNVGLDLRPAPAERKGVSFYHPKRESLIPPTFQVMVVSSEKRMASR